MVRRKATQLLLLVALALGLYAGLFRVLIASDDQQVVLHAKYPDLLNVPWLYPPSLVRAYLKWSGTNPNQYGPGGGTLYHFATANLCSQDQRIQENGIKTLDVLVSLGANPEARSRPYGLTVLHNAILDNCPISVGYLLAHGANPEAPVGSGVPEYEGLSPLGFATALQQAKLAENYSEVISLIEAALNKRSQRSAQSAPAAG